MVIQHIRGHSLKSSARLAYEPTMQAVHRGLGERVIGRWWSIIHQPRNTYVSYKIGGSQIYICGFNGFSKVYSLVYEKDGQIISDFYSNTRDARSEKNLLKRVALSVRQTPKDGTHTRWEPLGSPTILVNNVNGTAKCSSQSARLENQRVQRFLATDIPSGVNHLDLPPRLVVNDGDIRFAQGDDVIMFYGYTKYAGRKLPGRLVAAEDVVRAYFWRSVRERRNEVPALIPEGHPFATFDSDTNSWQIHWSDDPVRTEKIRLADRYSRFLRATVGARDFPAHWSVVRIRSQQGYRLRATRELFGRSMVIDLPKSLPRTGTVFSVTRELGGRLKLVEFYPDAESMASGDHPLDARWIMFKPNEGP